MNEDMLAKWAAFLSERETILRFIEWLQDHGIYFDYSECEFTRLDDRKPSALLDMFHGIDNTELDKQRRALLERLRDENARASL